MPVAARVNPKKYFSTQEWERLSRRSWWIGPALVIHCWAIIGAAGAMFVLWPNPLTYVLAVMLIGARQLGLAILMHEAAHGALHANLKINDFIGHWLCGAPTNASLPRYRTYHLQHHKYAQQAEDPDLSLSKPFPTTRASMRRKIVRDLTGQTFYKQRIKPTFAAFGGGAPFFKTLAAVTGFWSPFLVTNAIMLAALSAAGLWWVWPALWVVPMATWYPLVTRLRNIAEHALVPESESDPMRHARTTKAGPVARLFLAPYWVNYHCEHHMFMHLPCWTLPRVQKHMAKRHLTKHMLIENGGYARVLKLATSRRPAAASAAA